MSTSNTIPQHNSLITLYRISRKHHNHLQPPVDAKNRTSSSDSGGVENSMNCSVSDSETFQSILDTNTLKWQSWVSNGHSQSSNLSSHLSTERLQSAPTNSNSTVAPSYFKTTSTFHGSDSNEPGKNSKLLNQLTKHEFRMLSEQLKDVSWNLGNKFRGIGFSRFKGSPGDSCSSSAGLYRSQLAVNNKVFNPQHHTWEPYTCVPEKVYTRCRPVSHKDPDREKVPRVAVASESARPKSSIANSRFADEVTWGDYDMINAEIIHDFRHPDAEDLTSKFGERITITSKDRKGERKSVMITKRVGGSSAFDGLIEGVKQLQMSESSTSGIASGSSDIDDDYDGSLPDSIPSIKVTDKGPNSLSKTNSSAQQVERENPSDDDKSDDERIPEPETPTKQKIKLPQVNWTLLPDKLDPDVQMEGQYDRSRYDFDASSVEQPEYEFNDPFSPALMKVDLRAIAEQEATLALKRNVDQTEATIIQKCLEYEKLQLATEKIEESRYSRNRTSTRQRLTASSLSKRVQSAKGSRSTQCAPDCVQVVCVGDCPQKSLHTVCPSCDRPTCNGTCSSKPYTNHTRKNEDNQTMSETKHRLQRPKSCTSCTKPNAARAINTQQINLGRPKSSHVTYSYGRKSVRQVLKIRKASPQLFDDRPNSSPGRVRSAKTRRGRDSVEPHKSYNSQRRISLTAHTIRPVFGVNTSTIKQRAKSTRPFK